MSQPRRDAVLEIAREHDFLIIEDDPYGELVYVDGADTTPMKSRDAHEPRHLPRLVLQGPRAGAALRLDRRAAAARGERWRSPSRPPTSAPACSTSRSSTSSAPRGELAPQIAGCATSIAASAPRCSPRSSEHFAGRATWTDAAGGLFTFVTLHADVDTAQRVQEAVARGVAYIPGAPFFVDGSGRNTMRLTFAKESDERIREGVARLAEVFA